MGEANLEHWRSWIGRARTASDPLVGFPARALANALDMRWQPQPGEELPPTWHWLYFLDTPAAAGTGPDGHPLKGGFLPPIPLPRRMWASGELRIERPMILGVAGEKQSKVVAVDVKNGASGEFVLVTVEHILHQDGRLCIRELQRLVYRERPTRRDAPPPGESPDEAQWCVNVTPNPVLLFRYSALTYNAHRIHYDRDYAVNEELYPGLVVQAPLLATMLLATLAERTRGRRISAFDYRAVRPAFADAAIALHGAFRGDRVDTWTVDQDGFVTMKASAVLG